MYVLGVNSLNGYGGGASKELCDAIALKEEYEKFNRVICRTIKEVA